MCIGAVVGRVVGSDGVRDGVSGGIGGVFGDVIGVLAGIGGGAVGVRAVVGGADGLVLSVVMLSVLLLGNVTRCARTPTRGMPTKKHTLGVEYHGARRGR